MSAAIRPGPWSRLLTDKLRCVRWCNDELVETMEAEERWWCDGGANHLTMRYLSFNTAHHQRRGCAVAPHILFKASVMCTWTQSVSRWVNSSHFHLARLELWLPRAPPSLAVSSGQMAFNCRHAGETLEGAFSKHFHSINCTINRASRSRVELWHTRQTNKLSEGEKSSFTHKLRSVNKSVSISQMHPLFRMRCVV